MSNLDLTRYFVTEFTGNTLAFRKFANEEFSVVELKEIVEELENVAEIKPLYISGLRNKFVIQAIICTFKDEESFMEVMAPQTTANDIIASDFVLTGFHYDDALEVCTLHFHTPLFFPFKDEQILSFCAEMYRKGATAVFNHRLDRTSALLHRLYNFEILEDKIFKCPIFRLSCTFKTDESGKLVIAELLEKYSKKTDDLLEDCYKNCIISSYSTPYGCKLQASNRLEQFTNAQVTQICNWLHSLGAKSVFADVRAVYNNYDYPTVCPSIDCMFDYDDNFEQKFQEFIHTHDNGSTKSFPAFHLRLDSEGNTFVLFANSNADAEITCSERFYFLTNMLRLGAISVETTKKSVKCTFADYETRLNAAVELLN